MYLDPGFGGMLVQVILAIIAGGGAIVFALRKKIRALFSRNKTDSSTSQVAQKESSAEDEAIDMLSDEKQD